MLLQDSANAGAPSSFAPPGPRPGFEFHPGGHLGARVDAEGDWGEITEGLKGVTQRADLEPLLEQGLITREVAFPTPPPRPKPTARCGCWPMRKPLRGRCRRWGVRRSRRRRWRKLQIANCRQQSPSMSCPRRWDARGAGEGAGEARVGDDHPVRAKGPAQVSLALAQDAVLDAIVEFAEPRTLGGAVGVGAGRRLRVDRQGLRRDRRDPGHPPRPGSRGPGHGRRGDGLARSAGRPRVRPGSSPHVTEDQERVWAIIQSRLGNWEIGSREQMANGKWQSCYSRAGRQGASSSQPPASSPQLPASSFQLPASSFNATNPQYAIRNLPPLRRHRLRQDGDLPARRSRDRWSGGGRRSCWCPRSR